MTTREARQRGGQRFRRASLHGEHARLPDVLHADRPLLRRARLSRFPRWAARRKGRSIANLLELRSEEKIAATDPRPRPQKTDEETWSDKLHIVFATRSGIVKKTNLSDFRNIRKGGIIAIKIEEGDRLIDCKLTNGQDEIVLVTHDGMSIRFHEEEMRDRGAILSASGGFAPSMAITSSARPCEQGRAAARGRRERPRQSAQASTNTGCRAAAAKGSSR